MGVMRTGILTNFKHIYTIVSNIVKHISFIELGVVGLPAKCFQNSTT